MLFGRRNISVLISRSWGGGTFIDQMLLKQPAQQKTTFINRFGTFIDSRKSNVCLACRYMKRFL